MTRAQLVAEIATRINSTVAHSDRALTYFLDAIEEGLARDGEVRLVGFGTFKVTTRKARNYKHPQSGEMIEVGPTRTVTFKPGSKLKDLD